MKEKCKKETKEKQKKAESSKENGIYSERVQLNDFVVNLS